VLISAEGTTAKMKLIRERPHFFAIVRSIDHGQGSVFLEAPGSYSLGMNWKNGANFSCFVSCVCMCVCVCVCVLVCLMWL
jgi:hypothetical protein